MKKTPGTGGAMAELLSKHNEHRTKDGASVPEKKRNMQAELYERQLARQKRNSIMAEIYRSEEDLGGADGRAPVQRPAEAMPQQRVAAERPAPARRPRKEAPLRKPLPRTAKRPPAAPTAASERPRMPRPERPTQERQPAERPVQERTTAEKTTPARPRKAASAPKRSGAITKVLGAFAAVLVLAAAVTAAVLLIMPKEESVILGADISIGAVAQENTPEVAKISLPTRAAGTELQHLSFNIYGGESISCLTGETTVGKIIEDVGIEMNASQVIRGEGTDTTKDGMVISIDTVTYKTETFSEYEDYNIRYVDVQTIPRGQTQIHFPGSKGETVSTYNIKYVNGVEAERTLTNKVITKSPLTQVVYRGVGGTITVGGKQYSYSHYIDCKTTVYCLEGTTASGKPVGYDVIAVDPRVIPLGTKVFVDDPYTYVGFREAADTGGAIKGNFIDIWFKKGDPNFSSYGVRRAKVYILD